VTASWNSSDLNSHGAASLRQSSTATTSALPWALKTDYSITSSARRPTECSRTIRVGAVVEGAPLGAIRRWLRGTLPSAIVYAIAEVRRQLGEDRDSRFEEIQV